METEQELLEAIRRGEQAALRRLYDRYVGYAMAVGLRYVPQADEVRDVVHDSFVRILTSIAQFTYRGEGSLRAWVGRIVSNRAVDYLRQRQRFVVVDDVPDQPDEGPPPDVGGVPPEVLTALIGRLPPNYRTVLNLYVFEQRPHRDIAQLMGIRESSSASLYHRARKMLARYIREYLNSQDT